MAVATALRDLVARRRGDGRWAAAQAASAANGQPALPRRAADELTDEILGGSERALRPAYELLAARGVDEETKRLAAALAAGELRRSTNRPAVKEGSPLNDSILGGTGLSSPYERHDLDKLHDYLEEQIELSLISRHSYEEFAAAVDEIMNKRAAEVYADILTNREDAWASFIGGRLYTRLSERRWRPNRKLSKVADKKCLYYIIRAALNHETSPEDALMYARKRAVSHVMRMARLSEPGH